MNAREWARASAPIAAVLPGYRAVKHGFIREGEWLVDGFFAQSSAFSRHVFHLEAFALPLFVPTTFLYFEFGFRVGRFEQIDSDVVEAVVRSLPRLQASATLDGVDELAGNRLNLRHWEIRIAIAIIRGQVSLAEQYWNRLDGWKIESAWEPEILDRLGALTSIVANEGREAAVAHLRDRRSRVLALFD